MSTSLKALLDLRLPAVALVLTAATLLAGCVVQARVPPPPPPPPPRVYYPPPPPPPPPPAPAEEAAPDTDVAVQVAEPPPPLPDYEQPPIPAEGYLWTPGYWAYTNGGYYWVPGTWVQPPSVGVLWTPGYWGFVGGFYAFHAGYWGPHVGFYGGVNYGYGYVGVGFAGGRWVGNSFAYNRSVTNITNVTVVHNVYNETVITNNNTRVSFNGGAGIRSAPTPAERAVAHESHVPPTVLQRQHVNAAANNPALFAKVNSGHPAIAATPRPAAFNAPGVVGAHGATTPPPHAGPVQHNNIYTGKAPPPAAQQNAAVRTPPANASPRPQAGAPNAKAPPKPASKAPQPRPKKEQESSNKQ